MNTDLYDKIMARADADKLPSDHQLRVLAKKFNEAVIDGSDAKKLLGCWARARRAWCDYSGEPLI